MTKKRQEKIKIEAKRRLNEWLTNSTFDEMSCGGIQLNFEMSLGLMGYPTEKQDWMKGKNFNKFITKVEFASSEYDNIINELYINNTVNLN